MWCWDVLGSLACFLAFPPPRNQHDLMPAVPSAQAGVRGPGGLEVSAEALAKEVCWSGDGDG